MSNRKTQRLRINVREDPICLDPRRGRNMAGTSQVQAMLFEGLMSLEPDGTLSYAQADFHHTAADERIYTFYLKETFWSDGTRVTAFDFEKTWKDILNPLFPALDAYALFCVKGAKAAKRGDCPIEDVGIEALDAETLVVELEHPTYHFLHMTASAALFPVNHRMAEQYPNWYLKAGEHFVCNGPFKLTAWKHHHEMVLEKNRYYRKEELIKLDEVFISMINGGLTSLHMHASGLFDIVGLPLSPLPFDLQRELSQKNLLHVVQTPGTAVCVFNTQQFPFHNVEMRKAFAYAMDRKFLVETTTLLQERPASALVPPQLKDGRGGSFFKDDDGVAARECLRQGLKELKITAQDLQGAITFSFWKQDHGCPMLAEALQRQWKDVLGVEVQLEPLEFKELHERGKKGLFSMGFFVHLSMYYDPMELLDRYKYASNPRNYARWQNKDFIELLEQSERATSQQEHLAFLNQAEQILMDEMPCSPMFHWNYALLIQPYIKGFAVSPLGYLCLDRIAMDVDDRELATLDCSDLFCVRR